MEQNYDLFFYKERKAKRTNSHKSYMLKIVKNARDKKYDFRISKRKQETKNLRFRTICTKLQ